MDLNYYSKIIYARSICDDAGLELVESKDVTQPFTDGRRIHVPVYQSQWEPNSPEATMWWTYFLHEIYHHQHMDDFDMLRKNKISHKSRMGALLNIVMDHNIERDAYGEYPGRDRLFRNGRVSNDIEQANFIKSLPSNKVEKAKEAVALTMWDNYLRRNWLHGEGAVDVEGAVNAHPEVKKLFDKLQESGLGGEYLRVKNGEENFDLVNKIMQVMDLDPEQELKDSQEQSKKDGEGEGEGSESGAKKGKGEGQGQGQGKGKGKGKAKGEGEDGERVDGEIDYDDLLMHKHVGNREPSYHSLTIDYENYKVNDWNTYVPREVKVIDMTKKNGSRSRYYDRIMRHNGEKALSTQVKKYLLASSRSKMESGHKRGRLDGGKLWKHSAYAGTDAANRVFKQRVIRNNLDTAVQIIVDQSGSMGGEKYEHAAYSAILLNEVFAKIGIPVEIFSFTDYSVPEHYIHKHFTGKISKEHLAKSFSASSDTMGGNADGEALIWGADRLLKRKEKKKVMIVLSDGQPACNGEGDIFKYTKDVAREIETKSPIDLYAIGIEDSTVKRIYKNYGIINNTRELEATLLTVLKEKVLNHV